nr:MAG TPA: hypothetical protein [Caudoviricetes sp.]
MKRDDIVVLENLQQEDDQPRYGSSDKSGGLSI